MSDPTSTAKLWERIENQRADINLLQIYKAAAEERDKNIVERLTKIEGHLKWINYLVIGSIFGQFLKAYAEGMFSNVPGS